MRNRRVRNLIVALMVLAAMFGWLLYGRYFVAERIVAGAASRGWWPIVWLLLALGVPPDFRYDFEYDEVPLLIITFDFDAPGSIEVARALVTFGADVNAQTPGGRTALMSAVGWGDVEGIEFLLSHGADPNIENEDGRTALSFASQVPPPDRGLKIASLLVDAGGDPCRKDKKGRSPAYLFEGADSLVAMFLLEACRKKSGG